MADTFQKYTAMLNIQSGICLLTSDLRIFRSDLFTFLVGSDRKAIIVHSAAITEHSKALSALINNGMAESQTRSATLDDVEEDDFIRFCQFAYTGDYSTPPFTIDEIPRIEAEEDPDNIEPLLCPSGEDNWGAPYLSTKKGKKDKKRLSGTMVGPSAVERSAKVWGLWGVDVSQVIYQDLRTLQTNFENRKFCKELPRQKLLDSCEPLPNSQKNYNFAPVFLAHSRLYVFADKYGIEPLKQLVLQKLHQTLVRFELYPERVKDVVELVHYAYSDENTFSGGTDELRALVAAYMALRIGKLNQSNSFLTLLEDGGAFVRDFWLLVRNAVYV